jgi:hypothetical protein
VPATVEEFEFENKKKKTTSNWLPGENGASSGAV